MKTNKQTNKILPIQKEDQQRKKKPRKGETNKNYLVEASLNVSLISMTINKLDLQFKRDYQKKQ